ncbi:hypothetical protein MKW94_014690 [Papaver nudicaule]|uniref:Uncharacterized protein n=1 Tax=Papaver nudicaule TaxID=74823 RepID=A0AA41RWP6_PAPNU|nr:hypothetical protein [Papaver nudicaule]
MMMGSYNQPGVDGDSCKSLVVKGVLGTIAMCLIGYILGPPLYWHLTEGLIALSHSSTTCPPCICDCTSQDSQESLLSVPIDCVKHEPRVNREMERNFTELLTKELELQEIEALENQQRSDMALLEAKKTASQYQKEADKCNSGMGTCEEAREKAEAALAAQRRETEMWELRARQRGWQEGQASRSQLDLSDKQCSLCRQHTQHNHLIYLWIWKLVLQMLEIPHRNRPIRS